MKAFQVSIVLAVLMAASAVGGIAARPESKSRTEGPRYKLEDIVPKHFGDWRLVPDQGVQVVNPQTQALLDSLYSQILTRSYVNSKGYRVMLSIAYGDDQRGGLQAHKPEVCYPAQGFKLLANDAISIATPFGAIPGRRLNTVQGNRAEPVTYWINVADTAVRGTLEKRMLELRLALTGQVPDGMVFRVSSIDPTPQRAYLAHDEFVAQLLSAVPPVDRTRLSGLRGPA